MKNALKQTLPVALGYIPLGIAFGILFAQTEYHYAFAILMAIFVYAGAAQFVAIGLLTDQTPLITVMLTILLLNARHFFYGLSALNLYAGLPFWPRIYSFFALTDETFSIISTLPKNLKQTPAFLLKISFLNHLWWITGCTIGALFGHIAYIDIQGLEFSLTALFIVLLIEQYYATKAIKPILYAIISVCLALLLGWVAHFLISCLILASFIFLSDKTVSAFWKNFKNQV